LSARHYKMPAQQQAVDVMRHPIGAFRSSLGLDSDDFYANATKHIFADTCQAEETKKEQPQRLCRWGCLIVPKNK
jgi:hypothetical protein